MRVLHVHPVTSARHHSRVEGRGLGEELLRERDQVRCAVVDGIGAHAVAAAERNIVVCKALRVSHLVSIYIERVR